MTAKIIQEFLVVKMVPKWLGWTISTYRLMEIIDRLHNVIPYILKIKNPELGHKTSFLAQEKMADAMLRGELMELVNKLPTNKFNTKVKCLFLCSPANITAAIVMIFIRVPTKARNALIAMRKSNSMIICFFLPNKLYP